MGGEKTHCSSFRLLQELSEVRNSDTSVTLREIFYSRSELNRVVKTDKVLLQRHRGEVGSKRRNANDVTLNSAF